jgi:hypothetical protein
MRRESARTKSLARKRSHRKKPRKWFQAADPFLFRRVVDERDSYDREDHGKNPKDEARDGETLSASLRLAVGSPPSDSAEYHTEDAKRKGDPREERKQPDQRADETAYKPGHRQPISTPQDGDVVLGNRMRRTARRAEARPFPYLSFSISSWQVVRVGD